jgi:hypothetical protein
MAYWFSRLHFAQTTAQRRAANEWFDHTLYSRLNDKQTSSGSPLARGRRTICPQDFLTTSFAGKTRRIEPHTLTSATRH